MKATFRYIIFSLLLITMSCGQNTNASKDNAPKSTDVLKKECYLAVDSLDTARLKLNYLRSGEVNGSLVIDYANKSKNDGEIKGKFKGDTLYVDYTFKIPTKNPVVYRNPLALLKSNGKLILGVGQIETTLGRSYFVRNKAIDYRQVKFKFDPADCPADAKP